MAKRKVSGDESPIMLSFIPAIPIVNDSAEFWKNVNDSECYFYECKKQKWFETSTLCPECVDLKNGKMTINIMLHFLSHPDHATIIQKYDDVKKTDYFMETLFMMNKILWYSR